VFAIYFRSWIGPMKWKCDVLNEACQGWVLALTFLVAKGTHFSLDIEIKKRTKKRMLTHFLFLKEPLILILKHFYGTFDVVLRLVFWISKISILFYFNKIRSSFDWRSSSIPCTLHITKQKFFCVLLVCLTNPHTPK
jgi:hypothetical protein